MRRAQRLLLKHCLKGDRKHQKALYEFYGPTVYSLCLFHMGDQLDAEEMLQEVFLSLFNTLHTFNEEESLDDWLRKIFENLLSIHCMKKPVTI